jgi:hypothetical protein
MFNEDKVSGMSANMLLDEFKKELYASENRIDTQNNTISVHNVNVSDKKKGNKGQVCFKWRDNGKCKFGDKCRFSHDGNSRKSDETCDFCHKPGHKQKFCNKRKNFLKDKKEFFSANFVGTDDKLKEFNEKRVKEYGKGVKNQCVHVSDSAVPDVSVMPSDVSVSPDVSCKSDVVSSSCVDGSVGDVKSNVNVFHARVPDIKGESVAFHDEDWIVDNACTNHICSDSSIMFDMKPSVSQVQVANGQIVYAKKRGSVRIGKMILRNVIYLENFKNLISVEQLLSDNPDWSCCIQGQAKDLRFLDENHDTVLLAPKDISSKLWRVPLRKNYREGSDESCLCCDTLVHSNLTEAEERNSLWMWHCRLAHRCEADLRRMWLNNLLKGFDLKVKDKLPFCRSCAEAKIKVRNIPKNKSVKHIPKSKPVSDKSTTKPTKQEFMVGRRKLDIVHTDAMGPFPPSVEGHRYGLVLVDGCTNKVKVVRMSSLSECVDEIISYALTNINTESCVIGIIRADNAKYFAKSTKLGLWLKRMGIRRQFSTEYSPFQNGKAENTVRNFKQGTRVMMVHANAPVELWSACMEYYECISQVFPHPHNPHTTPGEMWYGVKPDVSMFRIFGCVCYALIHKGERREPRTLSPFHKRGRRLMFVGIPFGTKKCWRLYDPKTNKFIDSRDVIFDESEMYFSPGDELKSLADFFDENAVSPFSEDPPEEFSEGVRIEVQHDDDDVIEVVDNDVVDNDVVENDVVDNDVVDNDVVDNDIVDNDVVDFPVDREVDEVVDISLPIDDGKYDVLNEDLVVQEVSQPEVDQPGEQVEIEDVEESELLSVPVRRSSRSTRGKPAERFDPSAAYATKVKQGIRPPRNFREAMECPGWVESMEGEIKQFVDNKTFELVRRPKDRKPIKGRWVYNIKDSGKLRARWVARGDQQEYKLDYDQTFSPVVAYEFLRVMLSIAALLDLQVDAMDATCAFLHARLNSETVLYMEQPPGFEVEGKEDWVWRVTGAIYGLKQSPREWNKDVSDFLASLGFKKLTTEPCIFKEEERKTNQKKIPEILLERSPNGKWTLVALYVDDFLVFSNDPRRRAFLKRELSKKYNMKDLGIASSFVGLDIVHDREAKTIKVSQSRYIAEVLDRFNMADCNSEKTPYIDSEKLSYDMSPKTDKEKLDMKKVPYREAVGSLLHIARCTRPDISERVRAVGRYSHNPGRGHWRAIKRILSYLQGTKHLGITYGAQRLELLTGGDEPPPHPLEIRVYCDADHAGCVDTRRSVSGYVLFLNGAAVSWKSVTQRRSYLSTTESEYVALGAAMRGAQTVRNLMLELGFEQRSPTVIFEDNRGAIANANGDSRNLKHIDLHHHTIVDAIEHKEIRLAKIPSKENIADVLTKPVRPIKDFIRFRNRLLGIVDVQCAYCQSGDC